MSNSSTSAPVLPTVTAPTDGSAALAYLSTPVVAVGALSTTMVIHGAGIASDTTLLVDHAQHAATVVNSTEADATLTASDTAIATRRAVQLANPSRSISNTLPLLMTSGYTAFGDSITYGAGLTSTSEAYPYLLASSLALPLSDYGISGDQACDIFPRQIFPNRVGYTAVAAPLYSVMIGTNDVNVKGTGAYEAVFNNCHNAVISWLGTQPGDKVLPGDSILSASGGCIATADGSTFGAAPCSAAGTLSASLATTGNPIYVWYRLSDFGSSSSAFSVKVDGVALIAASTAPPIPIFTQNGTRSSIGVVRIQAASGSHTVSITTNTGDVAILGIGSNRGGPLQAELLLGDLPTQRLAAPAVGTVAQLKYSADIKANLAMALSDGLDVRFARDRSTMLGTAAEMTDNVHPNALGQQHLADAFMFALY